MTVTDALTGALVSPVITAHPTETRRRTVFDTQHRITELMRLRLHGHTETADGRRRRTRTAPPHRHVVADRADPVVAVEDFRRIETGLRYYPAAFFDVMPQVNARFDGAAGPLARRAAAGRTDSAARIVDLAVIATGTRMSPPRWCAWPPDGRPTPRWSITVEITALELELSMSARLVTVSDELAALAAGCHEPARADEPYRRAPRVITPG